MLRKCKYCDEEFDQQEKIRARGGYANVCIDCHDERPDPDENTPTLRGVISGSGKMPAISIVKFQNKDDADDYVKSFNASSGWGARKTNRCNNIPFEHVAVNIGSSNHKGRSG